MTPNPGHCPPEAIGKRVTVRLRNGTGFSAPANTAIWHPTGSKWDILEWEIAA
jgi:hypothetical protein